MLDKSSDPPFDLRHQREGLAALSAPPLAPAARAAACTGAHRAQIWVGGDSAPPERHAQPIISGICLLWAARARQKLARSREPHLTSCSSTIQPTARRNRGQWVRTAVPHAETTTDAPLQRRCGLASRTSARSCCTVRPKAAGTAVVSRCARAGERYYVLCDPSAAKYA